MSTVPNIHGAPNGAAIPAVIYGVKSSPDEKEAVKDQHRIIREAVEHADGREIIGTYGEDNRSGYRRERGPELEAAMSAATAAATERGEAELWVWHSSRLARGDGTKGKRSIQLIVSQLLYQDVIVRSVTDPEMIDPMLTGIASKISNEYSENLAKWTKAGVERRRRAGKPIGALPYGFKVDRAIVDGRMIAQRVADPDLIPIVTAIFDRIGNGHTLGDVARWLNGRGLTTRPRKDNPNGTPFVARTIRLMIENDAYTGGKGYPRIVTDDQAHAARDALARRDPAAVQRGKGGRPARRPYLLRGIAFCGRCGQPMYSTAAYCSGRAYVCSHKLQATGKCDAPAVPADVLETHVIRHLETFVGSVESWIGDRVNERQAEAAGRERRVGVERDRLADLEATRARAMGRWATLEDDDLAKLALEAVKHQEAEIETARARVKDAEAAAAEMQGSPDVDRLLDYYNRLVEAVSGRLDGTAEVEALQGALASVLAGLWIEREDDRDRLLVQFALREPTASKLPDGTAPADDRMWLPPARLHVGRRPQSRATLPNVTTPPLETSQLTTVSA